MEDLNRIGCEARELDVSQRVEHLWAHRLHLLRPLLRHEVGERSDERALRSEVSDHDVNVVVIEPSPVETMFGERALDEIENLERTGAYEWFYNIYDDRQFIDKASGPFNRRMSLTSSSKSPTKTSRTDATPSVRGGIACSPALPCRSRCGMRSGTLSTRLHSGWFSRRCPHSVQAVQERRTLKVDRVTSTVGSMSTVTHWTTMNWSS